MPDELRVHQADKAAPAVVPEPQPEGDDVPRQFLTDLVDHCFHPVPPSSRFTHHIIDGRRLATGNHFVPAARERREKCFYNVFSPLSS